MPTVDPNIEAEIRRGKLEQQRKLQRMTMARLPAGGERDAAASQFQSLGSELGVIGRVQNRENVAARGPVGAEEAAVRHARIKEQAISARAFTRSDQNVQLLERGGLGDTDAARGQAELGIDSLKKFNDQSRAPLPQPFDGGPSFEDRSRSRQVAEADLRRRRAAGSDAVQEQRAQLPDQRGRELDTSVHDATKAGIDSNMAEAEAAGRKAGLEADAVGLSNSEKENAIKNARLTALSEANLVNATAGKAAAEGNLIAAGIPGVMAQSEFDLQNVELNKLVSSNQIKGVRSGLALEEAAALAGFADATAVNTAVDRIASSFEGRSGASSPLQVFGGLTLNSFAGEIQQLANIDEPHRTELFRKIVSKVQRGEGPNPKFGNSKTGRYEQYLWDQVLNLAGMRDKADPSEFLRNSPIRSEF